MWYLIIFGVNYYPSSVGKTLISKYRFSITTISHTIPGHICNIQDWTADKCTLLAYCMCPKEIGILFFRLFPKFPMSLDRCPIIFRNTSTCTHFKKTELCSFRIMQTLQTFSLDCDMLRTIPALHWMLANVYWTSFWAGISFHVARKTLLSICPSSVKKTFTGTRQAK